MSTREERQADRQARRQERRDNRGEVINDFFNTFTGQTPPPPPVQETPPSQETPSQETPVVDPVQDELRRQAKMVNSGNVNAAQAEYFKQQNEGLYTQKERTGAGFVSQSTRVGATVNPVSNRQNDNLDNLFGDLYGSQKSRGIV